jgi:putative membrane-bound dehydrogenase-like protein
MPIEKKRATACLLLIVILFSVKCAPHNEEESFDGLSNELRTPEQELAGFTLREGFVIELVASERQGIINPIDLTFDDAGRLWTQTAKMYPLDPIAEAQWNDLLRLLDNAEEQKKYPRFKQILDLYQGKVKGIDKILVLSNLYGNESVSVRTWADSLALPMSILPYRDGAYVAQGSELFFLRDSNRDNKADQRIPMFTGFGFVDTHTMAHALNRGPGDWIYFSHGALNKGEVKSLKSNAKQLINYSKIARFSLDAAKIEIVNAGLNNIWGYQLRDNGQWYCTEANDLGFSVVPVEPGTAFKGIGNERIRSYQPWMPELHSFRVGGTGISGLAFADDENGSFPGEWKNVALLANPITSTVNAVRIERSKDGTVTATHLDDLLSSKDKNFRPVNMEFGPDGCLYIADWYDKIISHNEIPRDDPDRDKSYGRIWRVRHVSQKREAIPDFTALKAEDLAEHLKSPSLWMKRAAWHQISDRPQNETASLADKVVEVAADTSLNEITRIHALWSLEGLKHYDGQLMFALLNSKNDNLCREAIRSLTSFPDHQFQHAPALRKLVEHPNPMVRSQVLRTLSEIGVADSSTIAILVTACKEELPGNKMGGAYERKFERYLALKALEQYPDELLSLLQSKANTSQPIKNLLWSVQALPANQMDRYFLKLWSIAGINELDESTFVQVSRMIGSNEIFQTMKKVFRDTTHAVNYLNFALSNQQDIQSERMSYLLQRPVEHLLKSRSVSDQQIALNAIIKLNVNVPDENIIPFVSEQNPPTLIRLALEALHPETTSGLPVFMKVIDDERYDFEVRLRALQSITRLKRSIAIQKLKSWLPQMTTQQKNTLVSSFAVTPHGASILLELYGQHLLALQDFSHAAAEQIYVSNLNDTAAKSLVTMARKRADEERRAFNGRKMKLISMIEQKKGSTERGKSLFDGMCLKCHKVGSSGQDIAPALDGSSTRTSEALVTAILNPDAAIEEGYALYRVVKKDNSVMEGYLYHKDDRGATLAFMGGTKVFFEAGDIREQGFVAGRSFMPKGLIDSYSEEQIADLLSYIGTLK